MPSAKLCMAPVVTSFRFLWLSSAQVDRSKILKTPVLSPFRTMEVAELKEHQINLVSNNVCASRKDIRSQNQNKTLL